MEEKMAPEDAGNNKDKAPALPAIEERKTVLVTGGAGFIGSHVADYLMSRGDKVVIVDEMNDYYDLRQKNYNLEYLYVNVLIELWAISLSHG
jgi:UDP-glucuronate 4-epimerase|tara:strand:- start:235 stop:510 length:276 start_codon:yes stop_codon:yes gene_type:complete